MALTSLTSLNSLTSPFAKVEYIYTQTCEDSHSKDMDKAKDMEKIMVTAVVVTSNRKEWLEKI